MAFLGLEYQELGSTWLSLEARMYLSCSFISSLCLVSLVFPTPTCTPPSGQGGLAALWFPPHPTASPSHCPSQPLPRPHLSWDSQSTRGWGTCTPSIFPRKGDRVRVSSRLGQYYSYRLLNPCYVPASGSLITITAPKLSFILKA